MIQVQLIKTSLQSESSILLQNLDLALDKEKFFGKVLLSYESGQLKGVKIEQNFTLNELRDKLI